MNASKIAQHVTEDDDGYNLHIAVNEQFAGVQVNSITMYIVKEKEDDESDFWGDGDLAVNWSMEGLVNNENAHTMGNLLLRDVRSDDDVTKVMGEFYWQNGFDERLHDLLLAAGFSAEAVKGVNTSEWGMQDEERASYDAYDIAHEVRAAMA